MQQRFLRVIALVVAIASIIPMSLFAENRNRNRTDLYELAAELERVLGRGSVVVERVPRSTPRHDLRVGRQDPRAAAPSHEQAIVDAMNRERAAHGLARLRLDDRLSLAAGDRIGDMFAKSYFDHVAPDGTQPFVWAKRRGYRYRTIGENLALGYYGTRVVDGWMRSPGHRANILQRRFHDVGIAIADGSPQGGYSGPTVVAMYAAR